MVGFDAPTANELGKDNLNKLVGWTGIAGPDDLPDDLHPNGAGYERTGERFYEAAFTARNAPLRLVPEPGS